MRSWTAVVHLASSTRSLSLAALALLGACFNEAGDSGDGGDDTGSADASASSSGGGSTSTGTSAGSSSDASTADTTIATADTGTGDTSSTGDASTSTGEPVDPCLEVLACDGGELLCESFEPPFALDRAPWGTTGGAMAEPPMVSEQAAACGTQSISTSVDPNDELYSQFGVTFPAGDLTSGRIRIRAKYWLEAPCFGGPAIRILTLQFPQPGGTLWYQFEVTLSPLELTLLSSDQTINRVPRSAVIDFEPATWSELVFEYDMTTNPPTAALALDGVSIDDGANPNLNGPLMQPTPLLFGIYAFDQPFPEGCEAYVDDVIVEPG